MKDLQELRWNASASAINKGHTLIYWDRSPRHGELRSTLAGRCCDCGAELQVATNPDTVQGEALDYPCDGRPA